MEAPQEPLNSYPWILAGRSWWPLSVKALLCTVTFLSVATEAGSQGAQASLELIIQPRMTLNS